MIFNLLTPNVHISKDGLVIFSVSSTMCVEARGVCLFKKEKNITHVCEVQLHPQGLYFFSF